MSPDPPLVAMTDVTKRIRTRAVLNGVSLEIYRGRLLALLGPNGAGKTTSVRTMTGLVRPDSGEVTVRGERLTEQNADRLRSAFGVQSDGALYESLTVYDNLDTWGRLYGLGARARATRIDEVLELFSLADRRDTRLNELSKGLRQRVALSRAIVSRPEVLLLDEPTAGLDPSSVRTLYEFLDSLRKSAEIGIMVCTHQLEGIQSVCDDVAIIDRGRVVIGGHLSSVIAERWPRTEFEIRVSPDDADRGAEVLQRAISSRGRSDATTLRVVSGTDLADAIPAVALRDLVEAGIPIQSAVRTVRGLEDLYFDALGEQT